MLPDRSKRYAGVDGQIARLELAANWQLLVVALLVIALLMAIFPRNALIEQLYQQQTLDDLTLSYVQNLYRTNPKHADAALLLARAQRDAMDIPRLESLVLDLTTSGDLRQRNEARAVLFKAYRDRLSKHVDKVETSRLTERLIGLLQGAKTDDLPDSLARMFGDEAFKLNMPQLGFGFYRRLQMDPSVGALESYGDMALGNGQHAAAATYYFMAREQAGSIEESRRLFQRGIRALMAASLFTQAMAEARLRLGDLADDPQTLRFLSRTAMSAGDPVAAAGYARRLVFR
jgi:polysaccharide biosynthesis protein PelB